MCVLTYSVFNYQQTDEDMYYQTNMRIIMLFIFVFFFQTYDIVDDLPKKCLENQKCGHVRMI